VTDDRGRLWRRPLEFYHSWTSRGAGDVNDAGHGGTVWATVVRRAVATLPDDLLGLDRLNAASDVLDGRLDALPDGVEVTKAWRERCAIAAQAGSVAEPDDRPVMAWWVGGDGWWYVSPQTGRVEKLNKSDPHPLDVAKAMGWRAVEVSRD